MPNDDTPIPIDHAAAILKIISNGTRPGRGLMDEVRELIAETLLADATQHAREIDLSGCRRLVARLPSSDLTTLAAS